MAQSAFSVGASDAGGNYVYVSQQTATNSAAITFTGLSSAYKAYDFIIDDVTMTIGNSHLLLRMSTDNGANYDSTAVYTWSYGAFINLASNPTGASNDVAIQIIPTISSTVPCGGVMRLYKPGVASYTKVTLDGYFLNNGGVGFRLSSGGIYLPGSLPTVNAIQFIPSAGLIASATFTQYGLTS